MAMQHKRIHQPLFLSHNAVHSCTSSIAILLPAVLPQHETCHERLRRSASRLVEGRGAVRREDTRCAAAAVGQREAELRRSELADVGTADVRSLGELSNLEDLVSRAVRT